MILTKALRFAVERWIQRGVLYQLLLMAGAVVAVALAGGLAAWAGSDAFEGLGAAIWWAFLRLTDPGYLGDDEGLLLRTISTTVTVLGYVLFMGSLIAIMTQWLSQTIRRMESGLTPISMRHHVVVLGWTNRTPEIIAELLSARGRLRRFLSSHSSRRLRLVILADEAGAARRQELRDDLGPLWREGQVFLRSGSSLQPTHLARLDLRRAAAIVVPGADFELGGAELTDTRIVKTLLSVEATLADVPDEERPEVVAEVFDAHTVAAARGAMQHHLELIASDRIISRVLSQSVMHPGITGVLMSLLSHREGCSLFVRPVSGLLGRDPRAEPALFPRAVVLGLVRGRGAARHTVLDPATPLTLQADDQLVLVAERYDDCLPDPERVATPAPARQVSARPRALRLPPRRRLLVLGWSHKVAALIDELRDSGVDGLQVTLMSRLTRAERAQQLGALDRSDEQLRLTHVEGDYGREAELAAVEPADFDVILFLASAGMSSSEEADARTVLGHVLLRAQLAGQAKPPHVLAELLDPDNAELLAGPAQQVLVSPRLLSLMLAHVTLKPELNAVYDSLFGATGAELVLATPELLGLDGRREVRFAEIQTAARAHGAVAVGLASTDGPGVQLNPDRKQLLKLTEGTRLVLLANDGT